MRFYDRQEELAALEKACSGKAAEMIVISGRRRVGKTRLVDEFLKGKDAARVLVVPKEERQVAKDFAEALKDDDYTPSFGSVREAVDYFFTKSKRRVLYVDEFPNLAEVDKSIPFEFQGAWEAHKGSSSKILIFSGSYVRMMDRIFTRQKAPLFGRAGYSMVLQPLQFKVVWKIQEDIGVESATEKIRNYCVFGGIPFYYELMEKRGAKDAVNALFFDVAATLKEEGQNILRQEFGATYKKYFSIIEAIGAGVVSPGEVANRLGTRQTTLSKYIAALQRDFQLIDRTVPYGQNPARSKKGIYSLKDNTIAFWFANVYGKSRPPSGKELDDFVSRRFEPFCREFLAEYLKREDVVRVGRWWGPAEVAPGAFEQRDVDVIVETRANVYVGECKWTSEKIGLAELNRLAESAKALKAKKPVKLVMFSKSGFSIKETEDTLLFDPERIEREIKRIQP
ncbi:MAG: ATP-binding protein [Candidatus Micrarchaeia archaeon]